MVGLLANSKKKKRKSIDNKTLLLLNETDSYSQLIEKKNAVEVSKEVIAICLKSGCCEDSSESLKVI